MGVTQYGLVRPYVQCDSNRTFKITTSFYPVTVFSHLANKHPEINNTLEWRKRSQEGRQYICNKSSNYNRCKCEQENLQACVNTVMNIQVPQDTDKFWIHWGAVSCWRRVNPWSSLLLLWLVRIDVFKIGLVMKLHLTVTTSSVSRPATLTTTPERHASFVDVSRVGCHHTCTPTDLHNIKWSNNINPQLLCEKAHLANVIKCATK